MYEIVFTDSAKKELLALDQETQIRIIQVLERISIRPHRFVLRLSGSKAYRLRVRKIRLILDINQTALRIEVLKVGNRETIYFP